MAPAGNTDTEELYREQRAFVCGFVRRVGGVPEDDVDDIVQEVFIMAHRKGGYVAGQARPSTWLAQIALGIVANRRRFWHRRRCIHDERALATAAFDGPRPFERAAAAETLVRMQRALDQLDLEHRAVFVLFELEGEPCSSIAEAFGIPVGTVHSRLSIARARFRKAFEQSPRGVIGRVIARREVSHG